MNNKVLINAFGIVDSGGITVLEKLLNELSVFESNHYYVVCNKNHNIERTMKKYQFFPHIVFKEFLNKGFIHRIYFENIVFRKIIKVHQINLIYNFSGSSQFFNKTQELVKIQNLLFFSKELDSEYIRKYQFLLWFKHIVLKRTVIRLMLIKTKHLEIQSDHVKKNLENFINVKNMRFYLKSDIDISSNEFCLPKKYDFKNKIKFLYIVGPHFKYPHKNFLDFTKAMVTMNAHGFDFEINVTLTFDQLNKSKFWAESLNSKTNFLGYISDQEKKLELFSDNTILISTSIIETLGLHVVEAIKNGVLVIVPNEDYANLVYGSQMFSYKLFSNNSLVNTIMDIINQEVNFDEILLNLQSDLKDIEMRKHRNIEEVFDRIQNV